MPVPDPRLEMERLQLTPQPNEEVQQVVMKHMIAAMLPVVLSAGSGLFFLIILLIIAFSLPVSGNLFFLVVAITGLAYLGLGGFALSEWYSHQHSALIITNQRILDVHQQNFFNRKLYEIPLKALRNVTGDFDRSIGQIFDYGTLHIERLDTSETHDAKAIPAPKFIADQVMHYHNLFIHGGVESAHNRAATSPEDDETPQLEQVMDAAKEIARESESVTNEPEPLKRLKQQRPTHP